MRLTLRPQWRTGGSDGPEQTLASGAEGLMIEVHPHPDQALSDGFQQLDLAACSALVEALGWGVLKPPPVLAATEQTLGSTPTWSEQHEI